MEAAMAKKNWKHIHFLGDFALNWENPKIYRFVPYERLKEMLADSVLAFVSPKLWNDPYEKMYFNVDVKGKKIKVPNIVCLCFRSELNDNSAAYWDKEENDRCPYVRLSVDLCRLCDNLDRFSDKTEADVYIKSVCYCEREEIETAYKNPFVMRDSLKESYIRLMSLKRVAYKYENELRIFIAWKNGNKKIEEFLEQDLLKIKIDEDKSFLKEIMYDPSFLSRGKIIADLVLRKDDKHKKTFIHENSWNVVVKKRISKCPKIKYIEFPCVEYDHMEDA